MKSDEHYGGGELETLALAKRYNAWILDSFRPALIGDVLEVGAGAGNLTRLIRAREGVRSTTALEPAGNLFPLLLRNCESLPDTRCVNGDLSSQMSGFEGRFDAIVYSNVLEHIEDDRQELLHARQCLRPGGWLCIFVPALPALMSEFDRQIGHYRRYTRPALSSIARGAGFEIHRLHYMDFPGAFSWWLAMRVLRLRPGTGMVGLYERLVPVIRRLEEWKRPPLGKNLLLLGRKPIL